jgi:hypothetical protein
MCRKGYSSRSVCLSVCVSVTALTANILGLYIENKVPLGFLWQSQCMYCVDIVENALFKSAGDISWPSLPSSPLDELSIDERDSDCFISRLVVCRSSDSPCHSTDSLLLTRLSTTLLGFTFFVCTRSADLACTCYYYAMVCNQILVVTLGLVVLLLHWLTCSLHICM